MPVDVLLLYHMMPIGPEIILAISAMIFLMMGVYGDNKSPFLISSLAVVILILVGWYVWLLPDNISLAKHSAEQLNKNETLSNGMSNFYGAFIVDDFARFMKLLTLAGSASAIIMAIAHYRHEKFLNFEYPVLVILATLGMMLMISANDMIALYMGLELQALSLYILAAINRESSRSTEAGLKYFVLGALSSGLLLYGMSLIYGFTGHTSYDAIAAAIHDNGTSLGIVFGLVFILAGVAFKISAAPFHMWTPDVYEGAPTPVTAFFAAAPKVAAMAVFIRLVGTAFEGLWHEWQQIIVFISILSMVLGAFAAIGQTNIKRLLAYSSIGHMGFALVSLAAGTHGGVKGTIIYITIYLVMVLGAFACVLAMRRSEGMVEDIDDLAGLSKQHPILALFMMLLMFSLAGIPPLAGFWAKWYVFLAAWGAELYTLAIIGVLSSVVGAFYYLRIIKIMYFDEPAPKFERLSGELRLILGLAGIFIVGFVIFGDYVIKFADNAAASIL